jgi:hypothetical protein
MKLTKNRHCFLLHLTKSSIPNLDKLGIPHRAAKLSRIVVAPGKILGSTTCLILDQRSKQVENQAFRHFFG